MFRTTLSANGVNDSWQKQKHQLIWRKFLAPEALHAIQEPYRVDIEEWRVFNTPSSLDSRCFLLHHHSRCVLNWAERALQTRPVVLQSRFTVWFMRFLKHYHAIFFYRRHLLS